MWHIRVKKTTQVEYIFSNKIHVIMKNQLKSDLYW